MKANRIILPSRYSLRDRISSGSFGDVYVVWDSQSGELVALKVLKMVSERAARALADEFSSLSSLNHPNLVKVFDFGFTLYGRPFFTMELIEGMDLRCFFRGMRNVKHVGEIIHQVLVALRYLHSEGILHGDIKPENIMVTSDMKVKLLDFGLMVRPGTKRARISGTPGYIAPEVLRSGVYSESSDLYALGVSLVKVITGKAEADFEEVKSVLTSLGIKRSSSLAYFISTLVSLDPSERFKDADQALLAIESSLMQDRMIGEVVSLDDVFVGRERELKLAERFLSREMDERFLLVEGVRGVGKRELIKRVIKVAQVSGYMAVEVEEVFDEGEPIEVLFDLIAQSLGEREVRKFKKRYRKVLSLYRRDEVVGDGLGEAYLVDLYANLAELIVEVTSSRPMVIVVYGVERFSRGFMKFINIIANTLEVRSIDSLLMIVSMNIDSPVRDREVLNALKGHGTCVALELKPFSVREVEELIRAVFGRDLFLRDEVRLIHEKSGGVPLVIRGYIDYLVSKGVIKRSGGVWQVYQSGVSGLRVPESLREAFVDRYRELGRDEKGLLQVLALYGRAIKLGRLLEIVGVGVKSINKLTVIGILIVDGEYVTFRNPLYGDFVRRRIAGGRRRVLLRRIAGSLSGRHVGPVRLAELYMEARDIGEAYKYVMEAYEYLKDMNELYRAYELLTRMKRLLIKGGEREKLVTILDRLAPLEELLGQVEEAVKDYEYVVKYSKDTGMRINNLIRLGTHVKHKDRRKGYRLYKKAYELARSSGNRSLMALSMAKMSDFKEGEQKEKLLLKAGKLITKKNYRIKGIIFDKLLNYYKYSGFNKYKQAILKKLMGLLHHMPYTERIVIYNNILSVKFYDSDYDFISNIFNNRRIRNDFNCTHYGREKLSGHLGALYYVEGNYYRLANTLEDVIPVEMVRGNYYEAIVFMSNLAVAYGCISNYSVAINTYRKIDELASRVTYSIHQLTSTVSEARLWLSLGEYFKRRYLQALNANVRIAKKENDLFRFGHCHLVRSDYYFINASIKRAYKEINGAIAMFRKVNSRDDLCEALLKKAIILCELGEPKKAQRYIKKAFDIYEAIHCEYLRPQLYLARGMVERMNGQEEAIESFREALKTSKRQMTREQTWQIQRQLALLWKGKGHLKRALKYYKDAVETMKQITESIPTEEIKLSYLDVPIRRRVFEEIKELKKQIVD